MSNIPVFVFGSPRGGTSVVAGMFIHHGLWLGNEYTEQPAFSAENRRLRHGTPPYRCYENANIKQFLKDEFGFTATAVIKGSYKRHGKLHDYATRLAGREQLFFKTTMEYYRLFRDTFPDAVFVFVKRDFESAVKGLVKRKGRTLAAKMRQHVTWRYEMIDKAVAAGEGHLVHVDKVVAGDFTELHLPFEKAGVTFDPDVAREMLRPEIWHKV